MLWRPLKTLEKGQCRWKGPTHKMLNFTAIQLQVANCICIYIGSALINSECGLYKGWSCSITWFHEVLKKCSNDRNFVTSNRPNGILQHSVVFFFNFGWPVSLSATGTFGKHPARPVLGWQFNHPEDMGKFKNHLKNMWVWDMGTAEFLGD